MNNLYPQPALRWLLTPPLQDVPQTADVDVLTGRVFDTSEAAWKHAARRVLQTAHLTPAEGGLVVDEGAVVTEVADALLDCDGYGVMWGWNVTRYATTLVHNVSPGHTLTKSWSDALQLTSRGGLQGTYGATARFMLADLLDDEGSGLDVVLGNGTHVIVGIAAKLDAGVLVMTDGKHYDLADTTAAYATYGAFE